MLFLQTNQQGRLNFSGQALLLGLAFGLSLVAVADSENSSPKRQLHPRFRPKISATSAPVRLDPKELLAALEIRMQGLKDYTVTHFQRERFGENLGPLIKLKLKYSKGRIYVRMLEGPKKDAELLYLPPGNDSQGNPKEGRVKAHQGSFPDITLDLSTRNSRLLEDQHHSIESSAFPSIVGIISKAIESCGHLPGAAARYLEDRQTQSGPSYTLELRSPWYQSKVVIEKDESVWDFAKRTQSDPFLILHSNGYADFSDFPSRGEMIVPRCYATRTVIGIDQKSKTLTFLEIYDRDGLLYESYRWEDLDTSPLTDLDFDLANPSYNF